MIMISPSRVPHAAPDTAGAPADAVCNDAFARLIVTATTFTATLPAEDRAFQLMAKYAAAAGRIAEWTEIADRNSRPDDRRHNPADLVAYFAAMMLAAGGLAIEFDVVREVIDTIDARYLRAIDECLVEAPVQRRSIQAGEGQTFLVLTATAQLLAVKYPSESGPQRRLAKIIEEHGEVAEQIHIWAGTGIKRQKHGAFQPSRLALELSDLLRATIAFALEVGVLDLLAEEIGTRHESTQKPGNPS